MKKPAKEAPRSQESLLTQVLLPLAAVIRGDLLALVHQLGMQAIAAMLEAERTKLCGERYKHDASRSATRAGSTRGELALGGRRVSMRRPRVTDREGHEVPLEAWTELSGTDPLDARALEQMAIGVATRKYARSLETLPDEIASPRNKQERSEPALRGAYGGQAEGLDGALARRARHLRNVH